MKKLITKILFGVRRKPVDSISTGLRTLELENRIMTFEEWCKEFNVRMLHDRKTIHIN